MISKPIILTPSSPLDPAISAFRAGGIIAYPTETFYALGVDPFNAEAVDGLFRLKGRAPDNPVSLIIADLDMLSMVAATVPPTARRLMEKFWPGPLTIVLPVAPGLQDRVPLLTGSTSTIGVRIPGHPGARGLASALASPITATSANPSGLAPSSTSQSVVEYFDGSIDVLIDAPPAPVPPATAPSKGSTVVDVTGDTIVVVREGEIPLSALEASG